MHPLYQIMIRCIYPKTMLLAASALLIGAFLFVLLRDRTVHVEIPSPTPSVAVDDSILIGYSPSSVIPVASAPIALDVPLATPSSIEPIERVKIFSARSLPESSPAYDFAFYVPSSWSTQAVRLNESLNFFDTLTPGATPLEASQVFMRYYRAASFQQPNSMNVISRTDMTVAGRPAVAYVVEKKPSFAPFRSQPAWRNARHRVVDVRVADSDTSVFYSFAKRPDLTDAVFDAMLATLRFDTENIVFYPIDGFHDLITKKPFGVHVTPTNSPVSPERFTGFHTGADAEIADDAPATATIPIFAIADGTVELSRTAQGYGGVISIRHTISVPSPARGPASPELQRGEEGVGGVGGKAMEILAIYGHLKPKSLVKAGTKVRAGQPIGVLGAAYSAETGGERRHLHFGLYSGTDVNIAGYVQSAEQLSSWIDPVQFLANEIL